MHALSGRADADDSLLRPWCEDDRIKVAGYDRFKPSNTSRTFLANANA